MKIFTAISALLFSAMLTDSTSARAALLDYAEKLLASPGGEITTENLTSLRSNAFLSVSFLQSPKHLSTAKTASANLLWFNSSHAGLRNDLTDQFTAPFSFLNGQSLHAPERSGSPPAMTA